MRTMTARELKAALENVHPDSEVWVASEGEDSRPLIDSDSSQETNGESMFTFIYAGKR
jgi:hypothetical protein